MASKIEDDAAITSDVSLQTNVGRIGKAGMMERSKAKVVDRRHIRVFRYQISVEK
jgi:hypothetical protein